MAKTPLENFFKPPPTPAWPSNKPPKSIAAPPPPNYGGVATGAGSQQTNTNPLTSTPLVDQFGNPITTNSGAEPNANGPSGSGSGGGAAKASAAYGSGIHAIQLLDQLHQNYMQQIDLANTRAQQAKEQGSRKAGSSAVVRGASATEGYRQQLQDLVTQLMNAQQGNALRAGAYNINYNDKRHAQTDLVNQAAPLIGMPTRAYNE